MMMPPAHHRARLLALACLATVLCAAQPACAAEDDALDLQATPSAAGAPASALHLVLEAAVQQARRPAGQGNDDGRRLSLDLRWSQPLGQGWRFGLSSRLDDQHPALPGQRSTRNSLRELQFSWQDTETSARTLDIGRVNQRHGQAYGYNPTDFFRSGATRHIVSADPVAIRENRLGTYMLSGGQLWDGGGLTLTWAPRLTRDLPSQSAWSWDPGATNNRNRTLLSLSSRASERWSGEILALHDGDQGTQFGVNATGLISDAAVLHMEWATLRHVDLLDQVLAPGKGRQRQQQAALGLSYAFTGGLSITVEAEYNSAGLDRADWQTLFARGPVAGASLFSLSQASQELASRRAWLVYATQKNAMLKSLDLTAFLRQSAVDRSLLAWTELRYHWRQLDLALQWQQTKGGPDTEYGSHPYRRVVQLLVQQRF